MGAFLGRLDPHIVYVLVIMLVIVPPAIGWFGILPLVLVPQGMILTRVGDLRKFKMPVKAYVAANETAVACAVVAGAGLLVSLDKP